MVAAMFKKILLISLLFLGVLVLSLTLYELSVIKKTMGELMQPISSVSESTQSKQADEGSSAFADIPPLKVSKDKVFNVLLLGIDRRSKFEALYRTDIMILISVNQSAKKIVFTSVPRDLWVNGGRINSIYINNGWPAMQDAFYKITGMRPDAFIQADFEDFVWLVDSFGGLEVDLDTAFTDVEYPNDVTKTYITVAFNSGSQLVNGKDALVLSRSRHGNNGEGSDFKRMQRQHKLLKAMPDAILSPRSLFNPFNLSKFYELVTQHMATDLSLADAGVLWSYYSQKDEYTIESFFVDSTYLYNPPMSEYGGAWVLVAKNNDYSPIHTFIKEKLSLIAPAPVVPAEQTVQTQASP